MSDFTDDDVTALARYRTPTFDVNGPEMQEMDLEWARGALDAVAPAIAARERDRAIQHAYRQGQRDALREAADEIADSEVPIYYPSAWLRARAEQVNDG